MMPPNRNRSHMYLRHNPMYGKAGIPLRTVLHGSTNLGDALLSRRSMVVRGRSTYISAPTMSAKFIVSR